jgi:hypothetical protein
VIDRLSADRLTACRIRGVVTATESIEVVRCWRVSIDHLRLVGADLDAQLCLLDHLPGARPVATDERGFG